MAGAPVLASPSIPNNGSFTLNAGTATAFDPEGDAITYRVYDQLTPGTPKNSSATFPIAGLGPYTNSPVYNYTFTTFATDALHPTRATGSQFVPTASGYVERGWVRNWGVSGFAGQYASALALSPAGIASVSGSTNNGTNFGGGPVFRGQGYWGYASTYDPNGGFLWVQSWGTWPGQYASFGTSVATNASGTVVAGGSEYDSCCSSFGILGSFAPGGSINWWWGGYQSGPNGTDAYFGPAIRSIALDAAGNIYFSDDLYSNYNYGGGLRIVSGRADFALVKFSSTKTWIADRMVSSPGVSREWGNDLYVDSSNNIYVAGQYDGPTEFGGGPRPVVGQADAFLAKYTVTGSTFNLIWDKTFGTAFVDAATSITADNTTGNVFAVVGWGGGSMDFGGGARTGNPGGSTVLSLTSSGTYRWDYPMAGIAGSATGNVRLAPDGSAVMGGSFAGTVDFGGGPRVSQSGSWDCVVLRVSATGAYLSDSVFGGPATDNINDVGVAPDGTIRVCGAFNGTVDFDPGAGVRNLTSSSSADSFLLKLASDGLY